MSKHVQLSVEADAARIGFVKRRGGPDYHKVSWHLKCSKCPRDFTAYWDAGMKPEAMMRMVRRRHWDVDFGMRPLCPDCAHGKDKAPNPKPEHQNFKPWVPAPTLIFERLLDAANTRAAIERAAKDEAAKRECAQTQSAAPTSWPTQAEEQRRALTRQRISESQKKRWERIRANSAARAAGEEALRLAQLKERRGTAASYTLDEPCDIYAPTARIEFNAPQAETEVIPMKAVPTPTPKITHAVFQSLDSVFDPIKRLYRSGYTDQRVARDCGTSEEVVAYLRKETFGDLAEDPRISSIRDDLELLRMESAETFAKLQKQLGEITSRVEQLARS